MIRETGRVVAVETDCLWVETFQQSTCGTCAAQKGCGQSLLAKWGGHTSYLRVLLQGKDCSHYQINDSVSIGIAEDVLAKGALFVYLVPLLAMVIGAWAGHMWAQTDLVSLLGAGLGLLFGGGVVRWHAYMNRNNGRLQPVLLDDELPVQLTPS
jgi:sigma-E factor negative regulatory protein RseC